jgi:general secretion pathway protein D
MIAIQGRHVLGNDITKENYANVTIDFNDVDINLFIKYISELTKKNFMVDREVKGKVTIISPTRISEDDAYRVFESVLEVHGFTAVPSGSVIKIVPSVEARSKNIATMREGDRACHPTTRSSPRSSSPCAIAMPRR